MKSPALLSATALLLGSWAAAQTDPFQRVAPAQQPPSLRQGATQGATPAATNVTATSSVTFISPSVVTSPQAGTFGNPRSSSDGSTTRVVFDLPAGMTYTLAPTFTGLRIDVQGAKVLPAVNARLGSSVTEYRAGGGQVTLVTPFPLAMNDGWRATEATIVGGTRVLILEFGSTLAGGAGPTVHGKVLAAAPATNAAAQASLSAPLQSAQNSSPATMGDNGLPPGDSVVVGQTLPPAPALPGDDTDRPSPLAGRVPGTPQAGAVLSAPRIGKNPGMTRVVLDLPAGVSYRMVPGPLGLRVELSGTGLSAAGLAQQNVSPEVRAWRIDPTSSGVSANFLTGTPTTARSGWRAQLLPPTPGTDRSRLAIDFSPALADLTPVSPRDKMLGTVPPIPSMRGTAILALAASYSRPRVVIDPGHGGVDPGAMGSITEKQVTLAVGLRVRELLQAAGVDVIMTRSSDTQLSVDKNTDLNMRAALGTTNNAQMYVSIHVNAMPAQNALRGYGIETWWNPNHPLSQSLAALLQKDTIQSTAAYDQGLRNNRSLAVLRNSRIPAALIEIGYTSHPVDGLNLKDNNYLDRVALGIATGIREALLTGVTANGAVRGGVGGSDK